MAGQRVRFDVTAIDYEEAVVTAQRFWKQRYRWARGHQKCLRDYWRPLMRSPHLSLLEKVETTLFLLVYHVPVLSGMGLLLTVLRAFGIGDLPTVAVLPLSMLLFVGPLAELCVGLLIGRVERRSAWRLLGFLPSFALSICDHHPGLRRRHARPPLHLGEDVPRRAPPRPSARPPSTGGPAGSAAARRGDRAAPPVRGLAVTAPARGGDAVTASRPPGRPAAGLIRRGSGRRLLPVALDLVLAVAICLVGFRYLTDPLRELEALGLAQVLSLDLPGARPRRSCPATS